MPPPDQPVLSLLTDFGYTDAYVGVMKGVIASRCDATLIDMTHGIQPGDIRAAAYLLGTSWSYFPRGTVHLAVVDPGVGTDRAILAASVRDHLFVAPDNGLLTDVLAAADPAPVVVKVTRSEHFLPRVSQTFHGRDIFAPVAAALANGLPLEQLGDVTDAWVTLNRREPRVTPRRVAGEVVHVDQFGNLITNIQTHHLPANDRVTVHLRNQQIQGIASSYVDAGQGTLMAIIGSTDRLEISIALGSAADELGVSVGETVWLETA